jgi:hypothetical protein
MPRKSAEARMMEAWQPKPKPPPAPEHLSAEAMRLWNEITLDRPADHFRPGTRETLATFCEISAELDQLWQRERACQDDLAAQGELNRRICRLAALQARLCGDLRLTPRANIERHSAKRDAYGNPMRKPWEEDVPDPWE